jgi:predicted PurR-regulated permease PerM
MFQKAIQQAEQVADAPGKEGATIAVRRDLGLTGALFAGTRAVLDGLFMTILVLYFLLVSGEIFLRRIVEVLPTSGKPSTSLSRLRQTYPHTC